MPAEHEKRNPKDGRSFRKSTNKCDQSNENIEYRKTGEDGEN